MQKIFIDEEGIISLIQSDLSGSTQLGQIRLVNFSDSNKLENLGYGLFKEPEEGAKQYLDTTTKIEQGYLERANLNLIEEMRDMILNLRIFEVNQKVLKETDKTLSASINGVGM
jgi:flagellar basal-body rod protein FlgG